MIVRVRRRKRKIDNERRQTKQRQKQRTEPANDKWSAVPELATIIEQSARFLSVRAKMRQALKGSSVTDMSTVS